MQVSFMCMLLSFFPLFQFGTTLSSYLSCVSCSWINGGRRWEWGWWGWRYLLCGLVFVWNGLLFFVKRTFLLIFEAMRHPNAYALHAFICMPSTLVLWVLKWTKFFLCVFWGRWKEAGLKIYNKRCWFSSSWLKICGGMKFVATYGEDK